ncbi:hypothetical protein DBV15_07464 [Temnothorax longispinosus]|uniref:Accumulation-associated protein n=1 Tax=Temnothorax longispinosus TaxID=300112 RepID=A0A4S2KKM5_9HYME|nr:hypothetical protein DBV15_07464 [Temnothorax longispinosus]
MMQGLPCGSPGDPFIPGLPLLPGTPSRPLLPGIPSKPGSPGTPSLPSKPGGPMSPLGPRTPGWPGGPLRPSIPRAPGRPGSPGVPGFPGAPGRPGGQYFADERQKFSITSYWNASWRNSSRNIVTTLGKFEERMYSRGCIAKQTRICVDFLLFLRTFFLAMYTYPTGYIRNGIVLGGWQRAAASSPRNCHDLRRVLAFYPTKIALHVRDVLIQIDGREKLNDKLQQNESEQHSRLEHPTLHQ